MNTLTHRKHPLPQLAGGDKEKMTATLERKLVQSGADAGLDHREDFETCPSCQHRMKDPEWDECAVTLVIEPAHYKCGCVALISECPKCFEKSWVHNRYFSIVWNEGFPKKWRNAVGKHEAIKKESAQKEWRESLCSQCKHFTGTPNQYNNWLTCAPVGTHGPKTECVKFEKSRKKIKR